MNDFLKELKKQWKHFTLKKLIICMIILIVFIILVRLTFKNNIFEGFQSIKDLALIEYEFRKYGENQDGSMVAETVLEQRIVWDKRIYLLQPAKKGDKKYSFWNINGDAVFNFDVNTSKIKSLGTTINTTSNSEAPTKPVMAIVGGKFKTIEKYNKLVEVGSDEFSDLQLNYSTIRDTSLEQLLETQNKVKKRLNALKKLKDYYEGVTKLDTVFIEQQLEKFVDQILNEYKVTPIGFNNPLGQIGWDTFNLGSVSKTDGVKSISDLSKDGVGEIIAIEGVPFGTILTLSKTAALANPEVFREPYETNDVYKEKLFIF